MDKRKKIILGIVIALILIGVITTIFFRKKENKKVEIEEVIESEYQYFILKSNDKYGVIDTNGNRIISEQYDSIVIPNPKKAIFICSNNDTEKNIILNEKGEKLFDIYDNVEEIAINGLMLSLPYEKSVLKYEVNKKFGLIDFNGNRITKAIYDDIDGLKYKEGELCVKSGEKYGVININGEKIVNFEYNQIEGDKFYDDQFGYKNSGYIVCNKTEEGYRYGYISKDSKRILDVKYNSIKRITDMKNNELYFIVSSDGQYGVIKNDENIIDFKYQSIEYNELNNLFTIGKGVNFGVYSIDGQEVIPIQYKTIQYKGVLIYAKNGEQIDYFKNNGDKVEEDIVSLQPIENGKYFISINDDGLYGITDSKQNVLCKNKYIYIEYLFDGYFSAYKNESGFGVIDANGNIKLEHKYTILNKISNSGIIKAEDMKNEKIQIYSKEFNVIAELNKSELDIRDKYMKLYNDEETKYLDMEGNIIDKNKAIQITEEAPDTIGNYKKQYYGYSQVQYTDEN